MSVEMDAGLSVPGAGFGAAENRPDVPASNADWVESVLMVVATAAGILAASSLGVWVFLS